MKSPKCAEYDEAVRILKEHGAEVVRTKKHVVWRLPDGRSWTMPSTPSDPCAWKNNLSDLRLFLGLNGERGKPGERRPKKLRVRRKRAEIPLSPAVVQEPAHTLSEQLGTVTLPEVTSLEASVFIATDAGDTFRELPAPDYSQLEIVHKDGWFRRLWRRVF